MVERTVETRLVCPAELDVAIEASAPPVPAGAALTADPEADAWIDRVLAWGARGWARLADAHAACEAYRLLQSVDDGRLR